MNKIILALTLTAVPFAMQASTWAQDEHPMKVSEKTIQAAIDLLAKPYCDASNYHEAYKAQARAVYECYLHTPNDSPNIEVCLLGDYEMDASANTKRQEDLAIGDPEPFTDIPYLAPYVTFIRQMKIIHLPYFKFLHDRKQTVDSYFGDGEDKVNEGINKKCREGRVAQP